MSTVIGSALVLAVVLTVAQIIRAEMRDRKDRE
jgi:hypothetical protein